MATYPGMIRQRGVRSTTVVVQADAATGTKGSLASKAIASSAPTRVTPSDVSDPSRLVKVINDIQDATASTTSASRSNPFSAPCIVRGVKFNGGQTVVVPHTLGRPFTDWHVARAQGAPPQIVEVALPSTAYPQVNAATAIVLTNMSASAGTYTIVVVGD